jgi:glyceraldehyde 3-phosphate dehydrogenase
VTAEDINAVIAEAAEGAMKGVLSYETEPKVSVDYNHDTHSSNFASDQTKVMGSRLVRVLAWYDNEWGFSCRMADNAAYMGQL